MPLGTMRTLPSLGGEPGLGNPLLAHQVSPSKLPTIWKTTSSPSFPAMGKGMESSQTGLFLHLLPGKWRGRALPSGGNVKKRTKCVPNTPVAQTLKNLPAISGDLSLIPGPVRSPGEGNGNPPRYSCLENPMNREAWQDTACGVAKSLTQLITQHLHFLDRIWLPSSS